MNRDDALNLQAYQDGELPAGEQRALADRLAADPAARALLKEIELARAALSTAGEPPRAVPETREFYWSKIEREIGRAEAATGRSRAPAGLAWWRQWLMPAAGVAVLVAILGLVTRVSPGSRDRYLADAKLAAPDAFTYRNIQEGVTLVWLTYPSEPSGGNGGAK